MLITHNENYKQHSATCYKRTNSDKQVNNYIATVPLKRNVALAHECAFTRASIISDDASMSVCTLAHECDVAFERYRMRKILQERFKSQNCAKEQGE